MKHYSEKEIAIFTGVMTLSAEGRDMHAITVQDIAKSAGIGKGTIYDYFSSKEEILAKTIMYAVQRENQKTAEIVSQHSDFKSKIYAVYDIILSSVDNSFSSFNLILSLGGLKELPKVMHTHLSEIQEITTQSQNLLKQILAVGIKEQVICMPTDQEYMRMAITSNIMAVGQSFAHPCKKSDTQRVEQVKNNAYQMLIKVLN